MLLILGLILRVWGLTEPSYWMDEAFSIQAATQNIWSRAPLYHALLNGWGLVFGWNVGTLRLLSVVCGLATAVVIWRLAQTWFNRPTAWVAYALIVFSSLEIAWSRQVRMYAMFQLLLWLTIYYYSQRKWLRCAIAMLLCCFTHELGFIAILIVLFLFLWQRKQYWLVLIILSTTLLGGKVLMQWLGYPSINYVTHYGWFLGTTVAGSMCLAMLAVWYRKESIVTWLWLVWVWWLAVCSLILPLLQYRYLFVLYPVVLILAAVGVVYIWQTGWLGKLIAVSCLAVMLLQGELTMWPKSFYALESDAPTAPFAYKSITPQPNFNAAYQFIQQYRVNHPNTAVATPYVALHQLYTGESPDYAIFINLTGGNYPTIPEGYADAAPSANTLLLVDQFAEQRIDKRWLDLPKQLLWEEQTEPWSSVRVYHILY